jgi:hypothetical protein
MTGEESPVFLRPMKLPEQKTEEGFLPAGSVL